MKLENHKEIDLVPLIPSSSFFMQVKNVWIARLCESTASLIDQEIQWGDKGCLFLPFQ